VGDEKDFQQRMQKIGELVRDLEAIADPASRSAAKELVQLLMDMHGAGLERVLEHVFQSGDTGVRIIDELGQDPLVSSLLILYGIHPDDLQTRIERKVRQIGSTLHKMGAGISSVNVNDGQVTISVKVEGHTCGSTSRTVKATVEEAIYEAAPDLTSLTITGLEEPSSGGFVGLEKLAGPSASKPSFDQASFGPTFAGATLAPGTDGMG
jgi:Fe-S cluster biogenesis protein NfuA